jgi:hypothetical protein
MTDSFALSRHRGRDRSGLETIAPAAKTLVDDTSSELAAPQYESGCDAMDDDVSIIDAEVQQ